MRIGVHLPHVGDQATRETLLSFAKRAEALGFDSLWVSDHVVIPRDYESRYPYHASGRLTWSDLPLLEPLSTLLFVAAVTERVQLGTTVLVLPMRNPVLHAKIVATLDVLSGGRAILGVGAGWLREEFEALDAPFDERGSRTDEYLTVIDNLWTKDDPSFSGKHYQLADVAFAPRPLQQPRVPIWVGGNTGAGLRRAARLGDAWHAAGVPPAEIAAAAPRLREYTLAAGRDPAAVALTVRTGLPAGEPTEATIERLEQYAAAGVAHICLETTFRHMERAYETLERFASDVRPKLAAIAD